MLMSVWRTGGGGGMCCWCLLRRRLLVGVGAGGRRLVPTIWRISVVCVVGGGVRKESCRRECIN
jgi:hypothetical protein